MNAFGRYIGIDYSGAETQTSSLKALHLYRADGAGEPEEVAPPESPRRYWTRRGLAESLVDRLKEWGSALVGIHHGFSSPLEQAQVLSGEWAGRPA